MSSVIDRNEGGDLVITIPKGPLTGIVDIGTGAIVTPPAVIGEIIAAAMVLGGVDAVQDIVQVINDTPELLALMSLTGAGLAVIPEKLTGMGKEVVRGSGNMALGSIIGLGLPPLVASAVAATVGGQELVDQVMQFFGENPRLLAGTALAGGLGAIPKPSSEVVKAGGEIALAGIIPPAILSALSEATAVVVGMFSPEAADAIREVSRNPQVIGAVSVAGMGLTAGAKALEAGKNLTQSRENVKT